VDDLDLLTVGDFGFVWPDEGGGGFVLEGVDFLDATLLLLDISPFPERGEGPVCASGGGDSSRSLKFSDNVFFKNSQLSQVMHTW
jgi:hypothetical protein